MSKKTVLDNDEVESYKKEIQMASKKQSNIIQTVV